MALLYGFGDLIYIFILLINAVAVLNEERFLARSESTRLVTGFGRFFQPIANGRCCPILSQYIYVRKVGWSASQTPQQTYNGYDQPVEEGIKTRIINLIAAVRTLLRSESVGIPRSERPPERLTSRQYH
jgi:hypothetical protein